MRQRDQRLSRSQEDVVVVIIDRSLARPLGHVAADLSTESSLLSDPCENFDDAPPVVAAAAAVVLLLLETRRNEHENEFRKRD